MIGASPVKIDYCLYDRVYIVFPRPAPQSIIDQIHANNLLNSRIKAMISLNCDFIPIEPQIFSLGIKDAFEIMFGPNSGTTLAKRKKPSELIDDIANQLLTFLITIKENPVIRYKVGSVNEALAKRLAELIDEYQKNNPDKPICVADEDKPRGVLLLVDRQLDLVSPFLHEATYQVLYIILQGMAFDLLPITEEREYKYTANIGGVDTEKKVLLNFEDTIWQKYCHMNIQNALSINILYFLAEIISQADIFKERTAEMQRAAREGGDMTGVANLLKSVGDIGKLSSLYNLV